MNLRRVSNIVAASMLLGATASAESPQRIPFNHPGLTVDLGVGLWASPLPMDYDEDGDLDLVVVCSGKASNGTYFFENPSSGLETMPVFRAGVRIDRGPKDAQVSYVNGEPRVMVPGLEALGFQRNGFDDLVKLGIERPVHRTEGRLRGEFWRYADYDGDGLQDVLVGIGDWTEYHAQEGFDESGRWTSGRGHGYLYLLRNRGNAAVPEHEPPRKIEAGGVLIDLEGWCTPNLADFDGDGDFDLLCGDFVDGLTFFENVGTRREPAYAAGRLLTAGENAIPIDLCMIMPVAVDWDADGDQDLIVGLEDGRVLFVEHSGAIRDGMPVFRSPRYFQQEAASLKFGALVTPVSIDWDGDGDDDLICGNTAGEIGFIENLNGASLPRWAAPRLLDAGGETIRVTAGENGSIQGPVEREWGYTVPSVVDWDGDGLLDILVNTIWGKVSWYRNVGVVGSPELAAAESVEVAWPGAAPKPAWTWWEPGPAELATQWRTTPFAIDFTRDGLPDLVMLDHEGYLCLFQRGEESGQRVLLPPRRVFYSAGASGFDQKHKETRTAPGLLQLNTGAAGKSGRRKLCLADLDGDERLDLIVNSVNATVMRSTRVAEDHVAFEPGVPLSEEVLAGHSTSPTTVDWDGNGIHDILLGAEDGFFYLIRNPYSREGSASP